MDKAGETLSVMFEAAKTPAALIDEIAIGSREQASALDDVSSVMRTPDEMTQHNAALVEETNTAIGQTETQASKLDRVVGAFELGDETGSTAVVRSRATPPPIVSFNERGRSRAEG